MCRNMQLLPIMPSSIFRPDDCTRRRPAGVGCNVHHDAPTPHMTCGIAIFIRLDRATFVLRLVSIDVHAIANLQMRALVTSQVGPTYIARHMAVTKVAPRATLSVPLRQLAQSTVADSITAGPSARQHAPTLPIVCDTAIFVLFVGARCSKDS